MEAAGRIKDFIKEEILFEDTTAELNDDTQLLNGVMDSLGLKENVIIGKLIPAGTGMSRYRNIRSKIKDDAIPEYWKARQRELAEAREAGEEGVVPLPPMTREEAEQALGGLGSEEG